MKYYFVTTSHLESSIWFRDEDDFIAGMNAVPIIALSTGILVVAFVLMSNHVHFILLCESYDRALKFINEYKRHYSRYLANKYGLRDTLRRNAVDIKELGQDGDDLERAIAYVQMNPVAANICINSFDYPWGTGNSFFRASSPKGVPLESLSARSRYMLLHSRKEIPEGLLVGEKGIILPETYVQKREVEFIFKTPNRMKHYLNASSKAKLRLESGNSEIPAFKDQIVLPVMMELCYKLFGKGSVKELSSDQLTELLRQMRFRFSSNINQMARLTGLSYEQIAHLLD